MEKVDPDFCGGGLGLSSISFESWTRNGTRSSQPLPTMWSYPRLRCCEASMVSATISLPSSRVRFSTVPLEIESSSRAMSAGAHVPSEWRHGSSPAHWPGGQCASAKDACPVGVALTALSAWERTLRLVPPARRQAARANPPDRDRRNGAQAADRALALRRWPRSQELWSLQAGQRVGGGAQGPSRRLYRMERVRSEPGAARRQRLWQSRRRQIGPGRSRVASGSHLLWSMRAKARCHVCRT